MMMWSIVWLLPCNASIFSKIIKIQQKLNIDHLTWEIMIVLNALDWSLDEGKFCHLEGKTLEFCREISQVLGK